ncbi:hypothetical protein [Amycolatopsis sp. SID8362]|uniref:hypothetical protein n=1 Tax=Amycolatopsis sp. SID8362 TaxID=2690346 RepID=UPI00136E1162|nr:hypothetical protein [Amycolatopsis sp. SID8362]NED45296.1 hypothetical protein [Amycolatopsis sp. SID8362]
MYKTVALACLAVLLAGCAGTEAATSPAPSTPAPTSSAMVSTTPTPVVKDATVYLPVEDDVDKAGLSVETKPIAYVIGEHTPFHLLQACGGLPSDQSVQRAAQGINYVPGGGKGAFYQLVAEYAGVTGADVVASVKQATACRKATFHDEQFAIVGDFSVPGLSDPQAGFCANLRPGYLVRCVLVLGHGNRATSITFEGKWSDSVKAVKALATKTAPLYVAAFDHE